MTNLLKVWNIEMVSGTKIPGVSLSETEKEKVKIAEKQTKKLNPLIPLSLVTSGAILLYLGVRKGKIANDKNLAENITNFARKRELDMIKTLEEYKMSVNAKVREFLSKVSESISQYKQNALYNPENFIKKINNAKTKEELLELMNSSLSEIKKASVNCKSSSRMFNFKQTFSSDARKIASECRQSYDSYYSRVIDDCTHVPSAKNKRYKLIVERVKAVLLKWGDKYKTEANEFNKDIVPDEMYLSVYKQLGESVSAVSKSVRKAKSSVINALFERFNSILGENTKLVPAKLDSIYPDNDAALEVFNDKAAGKTVRKIFAFDADENYVKLIFSGKLSSMSDDELSNIYKSLMSDADIGDINVLINRVKFYQACEKIAGRDVSKCEKIIQGLEAAHSKFRRAGENILVQKLETSWKTMHPLKKEAESYYISDYIRSLGLDSIYDLPKFFEKTGEKLNISLESKIKEINKASSTYIN